jgi:hypothetical protein
MLRRHHSHRCSGTVDIACPVFGQIAIQRGIASQDSYGLAIVEPVAKSGGIAPRYIVYGEILVARRDQIIMDGRLACLRVSSKFSSIPIVEKICVRRSERVGTVSAP